MIGGIGAVHLKSANSGSETSTDLLTGTGPAPTGTQVASTFAEALNQAATKTVNTLQHAEQASIQALKGDVDTRQVVDAVMGAQQALQTTIAIRDKIVSAYLEVSRMSI